MGKMTKLELAQQAVRYLASVCDGACTRDGQGFNGVDSGFGKSLATQETWTVRQTEAAIKMLKKYKGQLQNAGIDTGVLFDGNPVQAVPQNIRTTAQNTNNEKKATLEKGQIKIMFPFDYDTLATVKSIPGRRFQGDKYPKHWTAPLSKEAAKILKDAKFEIDPEITKSLEDNTPKETKTIEIPTFKRTLFPYQKDGVAFIESRNGRALLGDEMGLGKTIQALAWLELHPEKRPAIIVCPAHLKINWAREAEAGLSKPDVEILQGKTPYQVKKDIVIINYDILSSWVEELQKSNPQVLIFDEGQYIKSNKAQRTKAVKKLAKKIPHVIALSGTPIVNRPIESWNILQVINKTVFPNYMEFARTYCDAKHNGFGWDFSGASNKEKLHQILTDTVMIRRKKADVLPELPDKLFSFIPMEMDNEKEYFKAEMNFIRFLKDTKGEEAAQKAGQAEHLVKIEALKQLAVKGKMKQAIQWIRDFLETNGNKLVVFAVHKVVVDALMEEFKDIAVKVDGSLSGTQRDESVQAFQNNPDVKLFVGNIQAAGTGLTLTTASAVAFLELPWTPGELVQAEDRCHRIGQKDTVNIYYLLADNTIEAEIATLLDEKKKVLEAILDGKEVEETQLLTELIKKYKERRES
ncbi:MAG: DEAD/DEAH box helicase [Syntrophomonadaceae bacterium]|nr:DEAD/DEAH box helicase [Syntrophomonadaceae bacterium]